MKIGYHISKTNLEKSLNTSIDDNANSIQLFISSPKIWAVSSLKEKEIKYIEEYRQNIYKKYKKQPYIVIHGKYLYNFCRNQDNQTKALVKELNEADKINCDVIIHQGKNVKELNYTNDQAIDEFVNNIKKILEITSKLENKPKIILENSAHQGTELGYTLDELTIIWNKFSNEEHQRLGICIDLCHIFVAGELDLRKSADVNKFFKDFKKKIGIKNLLVIHFNDSKIDFDNHNDNHQDLLHGYISNKQKGGNNDGFKIFIEKAKKYNIPLILETPAELASYKEQIEYIHTI